VDDQRTVITERLDLRAMSVADLNETYPFFSDPAGWVHDPASRHADRSVTRTFLERAARRWDVDRLSYWTARRRDDATVVGMGGCQRHRTGAWNLAYRLAVPAWGHGYATEIAQAAIEAAHAADADAPVLCWVVAHNTASRRVAERLGLVDRGEHVDINDGVRRHAYTDRPVDDLLSGGPGYGS
jgi:RimJ/RimL family protein N-acetyltransferase